MATVLGVMGRLWREGVTEPKELRRRTEAELGRRVGRSSFADGLLFLRLLAGQGPDDGVTATVVRLVMEGLPNDEVLRAVRERFPGAQTTGSVVRSVRSKMRALGEDVSTTPRSKKAPPGTGVGELARKLIRDGLTNDEVLRGVREQFPEAGTTRASINWYRSHLRADLEHVPTDLEVKVLRKITDPVA